MASLELSCAEDDMMTEFQFSPMDEPVVQAQKAMGAQIRRAIIEHRRIGSREAFGVRPIYRRFG